MILEYLKLILQYSGPAGVVLIFWYLQYREQSRREENLLSCLIETVTNNTSALVALKTYIETKRGNVT